jgi:stage V sporulation protein G
MQITDIRVRIVNGESKMKAVASVTFDDAFVVHDIKIIQGDKGLFIAMPSKRVKSEDYRDIAHPINIEMRTLLQDSILAKYKEALETAADSEFIQA